MILACLAALMSSCASRKVFSTNYYTENEKALTSIETHALQFFPNLAPSIERLLRRALAQPPSGAQNQPRQKKDIKQISSACERFRYVPYETGAAMRAKPPSN